MLKKLMCLALSATIAAGIAACGPEGKSAAGTDGTSAAGANGKGNTTIDIAALSNDQYMESAIEKYKELHPEITINLKTYSVTPDSIEVSEEAGDGSAGEGAGGKKMNKIIMGGNNEKDVEKYVNTLNTEIMTGNAPDIISVDPLPYRKYADKNLLADLGELIQADESFDLSRYYEGILDAVKYKDRLYAFPIKFTLGMLCGDKTVMDDPSTGLDDSKWTWQDFKAIAEKLLSDGSRQDMVALTGVSELELLNYVMGSSYDRFIDTEKKNADFNNPEFKEMLNFCKELLDKKLVNTQTERKMMTGRGNTLFNMREINMPMDYLTLTQMEFNGNGKLYKLPGSGEAGAVSFSSDAMLAISSNSKQKNEAWEFIKYLLSDEVQSGMELIGFPVNKEAVKAAAARAVDIPEKGAVKAMGPDGEIDIKPATEEEVAAMEKMLEDVKRYDGADRAILKIILEEAGAFFKGQKPVEEVAGLIQNRVSTYLKE